MKVRSMLFLTLALAATLPLARADNASTPRDPMRPIGAAEAAGRRGGMLFSIEPAAGATAGQVDIRAVDVHQIGRAHV